MSTRRDFLAQTAAAGITAVASAAIRAEATADHADPSQVAPRKGSVDRVLRLAIVGTGELSDRFLIYGSDSQRARFVAASAQKPDKCSPQCGIDAWFDDYRQMYDTIKPDAVVVAKPNPIEPTLAAFQRGIPVLTDKPMATTWKECETLVATAERSRLTYLCLPFSGGPMMRAALEYLNEDILGTFVGAESQSFIPGVAKGGWYYDREKGGGSVFNSLIYSVCRLVDMLGPAHRVTGFVNTLIPHRILGDGRVVHEGPPPRDARNHRTIDSKADDNVSLVIEWPSGQQAVVRNIWGTSLILGDDAIIYGRHGTLWLSGDDLVLHSPERPIANGEPVTWNGHKDCYRIPVDQSQGDGLMDHFVDCILGLAQPICSAQQRLHVHEILFKGFEAQRTGRTQTLETTFVPAHPLDPKFLDTRSGYI